MYFRNKFDEEFLLLANNISPKGGSVRLDNPNPTFFIINKPAFDEEGTYVEVIPLLLYNHIWTSYSEKRINNDIYNKDKIIENYMALCVNRKDCIIYCDEREETSYDESNYNCNLNINNATGDLYPTNDMMFGKDRYDPDYDYEVR